MVGIYSSHRGTSHLSFVALSDTEYHVVKLAAKSHLATCICVNTGGFIRQTCKQLGSDEKLWSRVGLYLWRKLLECL